MSPDIREKWIKLGSVVVTSKAAVLREERCPSCGAGMKFVFVAGGRGAGSVCIACRSCKERSWLDGLATVPAWVAEVGTEFET